MNQLKLRMKKLAYILFAVFCCLVAINQSAAQSGTPRELKRMVLVEHFTSSTCTPCAPMNEWLSPLLAANTDKCVVIKYPMNFPHLGDPYFTQDGDIRRAYYNVQGIPKPFIQGMLAPEDSANYALTLNHAAAVAPDAEITGIFYVKGKNIVINAEITPLISGGGYKIYVVLNEKTTYNNVGSNGETEFYHTMMKMFPDGNGKEVTLVAGEKIPVSYNQGIASTHIEEKSDLEVIVFVQNIVTKAVLNAASLTDLNPPVPTQVTATQKTSGDFDIDIHWAAIPGSIQGYTIYRDGVKLNNELLTDTSYTDRVSYFERYCYTVTATNVLTESEQSRPSCVQVIRNGLKNLPPCQLKLYPNPVSGQLFLDSKQPLSQVQVFNMQGQLIYSSSENPEKIPTHSWQPGIYFVKVYTSQGVYCQRISKNRD